MEFPGVSKTKKQHVQFTGVSVFGLGISKGCNTILQNIRVELCFLDFPGTKYKKEKSYGGGRVQKSISSTRIGIAQFPSRGRFVHIIFSGISRGACFGISNLSKLIKVTNIKLSQDGGRGSEKYNHSSPFRFFLEYLQPISYNVIVIASQLAIYDMT